MKPDEKRERQKGISLPRTSTSDLRGRQSVRATFRLTVGCIDAISIVAAHLGIKQKSLFDHLVEDTSSLRSIAREIQHVKTTRQSRVQKTFVISRKSLSSLDKVSKNFDTPRDALVEYSVQRLLPIIAREREKHEQRKKVLGGIANHYKEGERLLKRIRDLLGVEDPVYNKLEAAMRVYENAYSSIESFIERSKIIEEFQLE
ncbi:MAG: hypothetical protein V3S16_00830 [Candidatus Desulfatibia sp.]|uniref:hypothetical protein n=1 Tax=Candidatus Desulfatibia sp. TaxID=3101189 RepID=UPI002F2C7E2F